MLLQGHWRTFEDGNFPTQNQHFCQTAFLPCLNLRSSGKRDLIKTHKSVIHFASEHFTSETYAFSSKMCPSAICININCQGTVKKIMAAPNVSSFFYIQTVNYMPGPCNEIPNYSSVLTYF